MGYVYGYTDANTDGLPDSVLFPEYGDGDAQPRDARGGLIQKDIAGDPAAVIGYPVDGLLPCRPCTTP